MHLHLPTLDCLAEHRLLLSAVVQSHTVYRRLSRTHSQPTFELNYTLNKINEILVSGGLERKKKVCRCATGKSSFRKKFWPWTIIWPWLGSVHACIISRKECLTCVSSGGRTLCGSSVYVVVSEPLSKYSSQPDILFFFFLLYFMTIKAAHAAARTSLSRCSVFAFSVQRLSFHFRSELLVYYTLNKRAGRKEWQCIWKGSDCCWRLALNSVLGWKTTRLLREI